MNAKPYLRSMRLGNCAIAAIGVFAGFVISSGSLALTAPLLVAMLAAALITGAGNAINDFFDLQVDSRLGKAKAKSKDLSLALFSIPLFVAGIILAGTINYDTLHIALVVSLLLVAYSSVMRKIKFIGNLVVALGTAMTIIFGAALSGNYYLALAAAAAAFFANVAREIIKDLEDMKGDRGEKKTLPMFIGKKNATWVVFAMYFVAITIGAAFYVAGKFNGIFYVLFFAGSCLCFANSLELARENKFNEAQKFSKYAMIAALAAFVAGSI